MGVDELLEDATVRTPRIDMDSARSALDVRSRRRSRRRAAIVGSGAAVVLVAVVMFALVRGDDADTVAVVTDVTSTDVPSPNAPGSPDGDWELMSGAPLSPRSGHAAVSTGEAMFVWGGSAYGNSGAETFADGAVYSYTTGEWEVLPPAPGPGRDGATALWTGDEAIIIGGFDDEDRPLVEPIAWNPRSNSWRVVLMDDVVASGPIAAVKADDAVIVVGASLEGASDLGSSVVALELSTGVVRSFEPVPTSEGGLAPALVWTGDEVLAVHGVDRQSVTIDVLDPTTGTWGSTITTNMSGLHFGVANVAWTGAELIIVNYLDAGVLYRPGAQVDAIPAAPASVRFPAVAVSPSVVVTGDVWFDVDTASWQSAGEIPGAEPVREFPTAVTDGGRYYVWGGDGCGPGASCVALADPGPGLVWTPRRPAEAEREESEGERARPSSTTVIGDTRITISVEPSELSALDVTVGPAAEREDWWFAHDLRLTNTSDRVVRIEDNRSSRVLGQPPGLIVAEPYCGYTPSDGPDDPVDAGPCLAIGLNQVVEPTETIVQEWSVIRNLTGLVPGGYGTYQFDKTLEYSLVGGDVPVERHSEVVTITYEIVDVSS
jgi:hypothetical protein